MKLKSYIKSCNLKQLSELLSSSWWSDKELNIIFGKETIEEQAKAMYKNMFQIEMPEIIRFGQNSWINTKTRKIEKL